MIKYNDRNVIVGYIKQLLHTFNLPMIKVAADSDWVLAGSKYIYKGNIVQIAAASQTDYRTYKMKDAPYTIVTRYIFGKRYDNITDNLRLDSVVYDSHAHEYLGRYLRFIRDFKGLDLMSMYNCFTNEFVDDLSISDIIVNKYQEGEDTKTIYANFSGKDENYKIYCVPVIANKQYTIAIDCPTNVEMVCGFYDKKQLIRDEIKDIYQATYTRLSNIGYSKPYIYNKLVLTDEMNEIIRSSLLLNERQLCLFIKLPINNNSSVAVIEGNYANFNDKVINKPILDPDTGQPIPNKMLYESSLPCHRNECIVNFYSDDGGKIDHKDKIKLISSLQLLNMSSNTSHPFADRLLEYITNNAITHLEDITDNIRRIQKKLKARYDEVDESGVHYKKGIQTIKQYGIWDKDYQNVLYQIAVQDDLVQEKFDVLGYVDKDVEERLGKDIDIYSEDTTVSGQSLSKRK